MIIALRLRREQSKASGLTKGSINQLLNKRLKHTTARWTVDRVGPFVELGALAAGPEWQALRNELNWSPKSRRAPGPPKTQRKYSANP
jgi:hypothetical protein